MTKLENAEIAVASLSAEDMTQFRALYAEYDAKIFDEKLERDAKAGKLDKLAERARAAHRAGKTTEI